MRLGNPFQRRLYMPSGRVTKRKACGVPEKQIHGEDGRPTGGNAGCCESPGMNLGRAGAGASRQCR